MIKWNDAKHTVERIEWHHKHQKLQHKAHILSLCCTVYITDPLHTAIFAIVNCHHGRHRPKHLVDSTGTPVSVPHTSRIFLDSASTEFLLFFIKHISHSIHVSYIYLSLCWWWNAGESVVAQGWKKWQRYTLHHRAWRGRRINHEHFFSWYSTSWIEPKLIKLPVALCQPLSLPRKANVIGITSVNRVTRTCTWNHWLDEFRSVVSTGKFNDRERGKNRTEWVVGEAMLGKNWICMGTKCYYNVSVLCFFPPLNSCVARRLIHLLPFFHHPFYPSLRSTPCSSKYSKIFPKILLPISHKLKTHTQKYTGTFVICHDFHLIQVTAVERIWLLQYCSACRWDM